MTIRIVEDGPDIVLTRSDHRRYMEAYRNLCRYHVSPPSFEEFVRSDPFAARSYTEARVEVARLMGQFRAFREAKRECDFSRKRSESRSPEVALRLGGDADNCF